MEKLTRAAYWLEIVRITQESDPVSDFRYYKEVCQSSIVYHDSQWFLALAFSANADPYGIDTGEDMVQDLMINGFDGLLRSQLIAAMVKDCELIVSKNLLMFGYGLNLDDLDLIS